MNLASNNDANHTHLISTLASYINFERYLNDRYENITSSLIINSIHEQCSRSRTYTPYSIFGMLSTHNETTVKIFQDIYKTIQNTIHKDMSALDKLDALHKILINACNEHLNMEQEVVPILMVLNECAKHTDGMYNYSGHHYRTKRHPLSGRIAQDTDAPTTPYEAQKNERYNTLRRLETMLVSKQDEQNKATLLCTSRQHKQ